MIRSVSCFALVAALLSPMLAWADPVKLVEPAVDKWTGAKKREATWTLPKRLVTTGEHMPILVIPGSGGDRLLDLEFVITADEAAGAEMPSSGKLTYRFANGTAMQTEEPIRMTLTGYVGATETGHHDFDLPGWRC